MKKRIQIVVVISMIVNMWIAYDFGTMNLTAGEPATIKPVELTYQQMPAELKAGLWFVVDNRVVGVELQQERGAFGRFFLGSKVDDLIGTPRVTDENGWAVSHPYGRACKRVGQVVVVLHLQGDEWTPELRLAFVKGFGSSFESTLTLYNVKVK